MVGWSGGHVVGRSGGQVIGQSGGQVLELRWVSGPRGN